MIVMMVMGLCYGEEKEGRGGKDCGGGAVEGGGGVVVDCGGGAVVDYGGAVVDCGGKQGREEKLWSDW